MPDRPRLSTKRTPGLEPAKLAKEASSLRRAAKQARDPVTRQEFEEMAEDRELVAAAIEDLKTRPPKDDGSKP